MTIRLRIRPLTPNEFTTFRTTFILDWAADLAHIDNLSPSDAVSEATRRTDASLSDGLETEGHYLFALVQAENLIGTLWFSVTNQRAFLDDLTIHKDYRGRGHGQGALELFEAEVLKLGLKRIDLQVYVHNPRAISLYEKSGYRSTGVNMRKFLAALP